MKFRIVKKDDVYIPMVREFFRWIGIDTDGVTVWYNKVYILQHCACDDIHQAKNVVAKYCRNRGYADIDGEVVWEGNYAV